MDTHPPGLRPVPHLGCTYSGRERVDVQERTSAAICVGRISEQIIARIVRHIVKRLIYPGFAIRGPDRELKRYVHLTFAPLAVGITFSSLESDIFSPMYLKSGRIQAYLASGIPGISDVIVIQDEGVDTPRGAVLGDDICLHSARSDNKQVNVGSIGAIVDVHTPIYGCTEAKDLRGIYHIRIATHDLYPFSKISEGPAPPEPVREGIEDPVDVIWLFILKIAPNLLLAHVGGVACNRSRESHELRFLVSRCGALIFDLRRQISPFSLLFTRILP